METKNYLQIALLLLFCFELCRTKATFTVKPKEKLIMFVMPEHCFDTLINKHQISKECFTITLSKGLGMGIILGSVLVKVPQIIKILKSKSADGIAVSSFYPEILMSLLGCGYNIHFNHPFSTYGESAFLFIQNLILVFICWYYSKEVTSIYEIVSVVLSTTLLISLIALDLIPGKVYTFTAFVSLGLLLFARIPQIALNMRNRSTGQLSIITCFLNLAGSLARIYTTLREVSNDTLIISIRTIAASLNGILVLHFFVYKKDAGQQARIKKDT
eukprot:TRINITY_DN4655_c0_g1_i2.p1 TRINITY_DN4655_c0_g1~~TRINITY_DN4655_c0_g1_i2.p1  ORF type:complete len:273 (+),score=26.76 TRINITY_DN4655_c0_g1_i2:36-854(+)